MTDPQHPEQYPSATPADPAAEHPVTGYPAAEHPVAEPRTGRKRMALVAAVAAAAVLVGGGGGFAIGRATAPETAATSDQQFPGDGGRMGTPPDGGQFGTPPGQDGTTTTDGTTSDPTT